MSFIHTLLNNSLKLSVIIMIIQAIWLFIIGLSIIDISNAALDPNALTFSCPTASDVLSPLSGIESSSSQNVIIELPISEANKLCTLCSIEDGIYIPFVSRRKLISRCFPSILLSLHFSFKHCFLIQLYIYICFSLNSQNLAFTLLFDPMIIRVKGTKL